MNRYLLNISYIGSTFRGIQKTKSKAVEEFLDLTTVAGCLEQGLKVLKPLNHIELTLSSRTDAGVHALHSTVHVDLEKSDGGIYPPIGITEVLNKQFYGLDLPIRVISTFHVPNTFHCRYNAKARTYLYRLAVSKTFTDDSDELKSRKSTAFIPIEERTRCCFLQDCNFDAEKVKETLPLFLGRHDFRTFMGTTKDLQKKHASFTVRTINEIKFESGKSLACEFDAEKSQELYNYWNVTVTGKSFLYRQVRRIVAALIAVAYNRVTKKEIYEMITIPSKHSWNQRIAVVPAYGLYLCKVHYNEEDFKFQK